MLKIIIKPNNMSDGGVLDLFPDTFLTINRPSDLFDDDFQLSEFSFPIELPWTDTNRVVLGFSERLRNFDNNKVVSWKCDVFADGYPEVINGSFNLLSKEGKISYDSGKFTANISSHRGIFGSTVAGKKLRDVNFGPDITWETLESRAFATAHAKGTYPEYDYFAFAPVVIQEYFDNNKNFYGEFLAQDTVNNIVYAGEGADGWAFARPLSSNPNIPTFGGFFGTSEHVDYRTVPFFKTRYILQKVAAHLGYTISGPAFQNPLLDDLYIFNTTAIEKYNISAKKDENRKIVISQHLPDVEIIDFLKSTFKFICAAQNISAGEIVLTDKNDTLNKKIVVDVSEILTDEFSSEYKPAEEQGGFEIDYEKDPDDGYFGEAVRSLDDKILLPQVQTRDDLFALTGNLTTDHICFVVNENMYYVVADATVSPIQWSAFADNLFPVKFGNAANKITIGAGTLATYMELDEPTGLYRRLSKLASRQAGCYINNKGQKVINPFSLRFFFIKHQNIAGYVHPVSFNHNISPSGVQLTDTSLALLPKQSIGERHLSFEQAVNSSETHTLSVISSRNNLENISNATHIIANNVVGVPTEIEFTSPLNNTIKIKCIIA